MVMNKIQLNNVLLILILSVLTNIGFSGCTMEDELTVVQPKTLDEFKTQMTAYLAKEKMMLDTARVGYNVGNYKSATDSINVKAAYLAAVVAAQTVVNDPAVTISKIASANKSLATPGKAFWAVIWIADRRQLNDTIVASTTLNTTTVQGTGGGQVLADAKAAFTAAIAKATAVRGSSVASALQIKLAMEALSAAKKTFVSAIIPVNIDAYVLKSKAFVSEQKQIVESSVVGYNKGEYPVLTRTNYLNVVLTANDVVNKTGAIFEEISLALTNMIIPKSVFLPFVADHRSLNDTIVLAETLSPTFVVGTAKGQVVAAAKTALTNAITTAKTARESVTLTEGATNAARFKIGQAIATIQAVVTLGDLILDCEALKTATPVGAESGMVTVAVNYVFATAITSAKSIRNNGASTYAQMSSAIISLQAAKTTFTNSIKK
jgi:hypothetical protein